MSSQNNWNNPDMYYQQPQSNAGGSYGAQPYGSNATYAATTQYAGGPGYVYQPLPPNNALAIVALVCSIGGLTVMPILAGIAGIIMGHIAKKQIRETGERGDGMATAALWVGYIGTALLIAFILLFILIYVGMFALMFAAVGSSAS
jgi:hypothetical protein